MHKFSSVQDGIYAARKVHMRSTLSLRIFPRRCLWNSCNVRLTAWRWPVLDHFKEDRLALRILASLLQAIDHVISLAALRPQAVSQAPQHFRSSETQATCEGTWEETDNQDTLWVNSLLQIFRDASHFWRYMRRNRQSRQLIPYFRSSETQATSDSTWEETDDQDTNCINILRCFFHQMLMWTCMMLTGIHLFTWPSEGGLRVTARWACFEVCRSPKEHITFFKYIYFLGLLVKETITVLCTLRASLSGTFLQTLPDLVTPLKGHSLSPRSCPATRSAPSERFGYW